MDDLREVLSCDTLDANGKIAKITTLLATLDATTGRRKVAARQRQILVGQKSQRAHPHASAADPPCGNNLTTWPTSRLAQYVGTYQLKDSEPRPTLELVDGKLIGTRSGREPAPWTAEASDVFFIAGDPRIRKFFQHDALGKVTGFVERRESWDIVWVKTG